VPDPTPSTSESRAPMTRGQMAVILVLCLGLLVAVAGRILRDRFGGPRLEQVMSSSDFEPYRINLNTAGAPELALLPGIGPKRAGQIIASREEHGPFARVEDLCRIRGISRGTVSALAPYATLKEQAPAPDSTGAP